MRDSNGLTELRNIHEPVFDDCAYVGKSVREGCKHGTARLSYPKPPLTEIDKKFNPKLARVSCRVEPV